MREPGADCLVVAEQFPWSEGGRSPTSGWSQRATGGTPCLGGSRQASSGWHEPDESRDSRPDLWGTRGANPRVYPAARLVARVAGCGSVIFLIDQAERREHASRGGV